MKKKFLQCEMIRCHSVNKVFLTLLSGRVLSFLEPRASRLFSHALLGSSLRPIFPAWQRTQLIHHGFTRLLFLFLRGCVLGKGRRWFVFFVRVSGLSWGQFFPHVVQFISQGFDQGFFFTRWNGRIGQQLMLLNSQVGAPFQQGVLQQLSLVKLHQLIKLLFRDHQDFVHGAAWGWKAHVPGFIRGVDVVDGEGNRGRRGRHEVDRCKRDTVPHSPRPVPDVCGSDTPHTCSDDAGSCAHCTVYCTCFANVHNRFARRRIGGWHRRAAPSSV